MDKGSTYTRMVIYSMARGCPTLDTVKVHILLHRPVTSVPYLLVLGLMVKLTEPDNLFTEAHIDTKAVGMRI